MKRPYKVIYFFIILLSILSSVVAEELTFSEQLSPENFALGFALATDFKMRGMVFNVLALFFLGITILLGILLVKYMLKINSRAYLGTIHCLVFLFATILTPLFYRSIIFPDSFYNLSVAIILITLPLSWLLSLFFFFSIVVKRGKGNVRFAANLSASIIPIILLFSALYSLALFLIQPIGWKINLVFAWIVFPIASLIPYALLGVAGYIADLSKKQKKK